MTQKQIEKTRDQMYQLRLRAERRYKRLLVRLFNHAVEVVKELETPDEIIAALRSLSQTRLYIETATEAARQMAAMVAVGQKTTWRLAAMESWQGKRVYKLLLKNMEAPEIGQVVNQIVTENSRLIRTVPDRMANELSHLAQKRWVEGLRPEEITKEIKAKAPHLKEYEARRIARTESAKASTALVQARAEALKLDWYIWRTARDGDRVRKSHRIMEGVICRWAEPPDPESLAGESSRGAYHPGGIYNCRCIALPVLALEDIKYPCRVHIHGKIQQAGSIDEMKRLCGTA